MRWLVIFLVLAFGGYFLYQRAIASSISLMDECVIQARIQIETSGRSSAAMCSSNEQTLGRLSVCLDSVQKQKFLAGLLYGPSGAEDRVVILINQHNAACPKNIVPFPTAELYL